MLVVDQLLFSLRAAHAVVLHLAAFASAETVKDLLRGSRRLQRRALVSISKGARQRWACRNRRLPQRCGPARNHRSQESDTIVVVAAVVGAALHLHRFPSVVALSFHLVELLLFRFVIFVNDGVRIRRFIFIWQI